MRNVNLESRSLFLPYKAVFFFSLSCTTKLNFQKPDLFPFLSEIVLLLLRDLFSRANHVLKSQMLFFFSPGSDAFVMLWPRGLFALWGWRRIVLFIPYVCLLIKYIFLLLLGFNFRHIWCTSHDAFLSTAHTWHSD